MVHLKAHEIISKKTIDQVVDEQMDEKNIEIEIKDKDNKWIIE